MTSSLYDIVQCTPLANSSNAQFVNNSYLWLNNGFVTAPSNVYFNGDFSVSVWIKVINFGTWQRIFDFGNGPSSDNVLITTSNNNGYIFFCFFVN